MFGQDIRPSESACSLPIYTVPKKAYTAGEVKWRLVIKDRQLNEKTAVNNQIELVKHTSQMPKFLQYRPIRLFLPGLN